MKKISLLLMAALMTATMCSCTQQTEKQPLSSDAEKTTQVSDDKNNAEQNSDKDTLYQVALLQSLTQGYYDGILKSEDLLKHGDTGIGTFEGVNGEMIVLDGKIYQAVSDGSVNEVTSGETIPFGNVTFFEEDIKEELSDLADIDSVKETLDNVVQQNGKNMFYMVKIKGEFPMMYVRSEYKQEKPYKTLDEALKTDQTEFTYENIKGTVVGLYCPEYMSGLNASGWHFHFISEDFQKGGHILDMRINKATAVLDKTDKFDMYLSDNSEFQDMDLAKDVSEAIKKVETNEED